MVPLVAATLIAVTGCGGAPAEDHLKADRPATTAETELVETTPAEFNADDLAFVTNVGELFRGSQQVSELVPSRSTDADLASFAQRSDDGLETQMGVAQALSTQWRADANPGGSAAQMSSGVPSLDTVARLSALNRSDFNIAWLDVVHELHASALEAAKIELSKGMNADARDLAQQMASTEQVLLDEIEQMRARFRDF